MRSCGVIVVVIAVAVVVDAGVVIEEMSWTRSVTWKIAGDVTVLRVKVAHRDLVWV